MIVNEDKEVFQDILRVLEREVEWPLTDVMDWKEVQRLLAPIREAINSELLK
jgi:hypothetical protein